MNNMIGNLKERLKINNRGFTLIEIIAVVIIISIISAPIIYLYFDSQTDYIVGQRTLEAHYNANSLMKIVTEDLRKVDCDEKIKIGDKDYSKVEILTQPNTPVSGQDNNSIIIRYSPTDIVSYGKDLNSKQTKRYSGIGLTQVALNGDSYIGSIDGGNWSTCFNTGTGSGKIETITDNIVSFTITSPTANNKSYTISIEIDPPDVGKTEIKPIKLTNTFTPRFNMGN